MEHDYDLHAYLVYYLERQFGYIAPSTIEEGEYIRETLLEGEAPIGWEDGFGNTIKPHWLSTPEGVRQQALDLIADGWGSEEDPLDDLQDTYELTDAETRLLVGEIEELIAGQASEQE